MKKAKDHRTEIERKVAKRYQTCWDNNKDSFEDKIEVFPKYIRRQTLTHYLARYDIFKKILNVKGSIIECGVYAGGGLMMWAKISSILEPINLARRIYGFDTFEGFPSISKKDIGSCVGQMCSNSYDELKELIKIYNSNRPLGHIEKVFLIKGDANKTIPQFIEKNPSVLVSLMFLDFEIYEPTKTAIEYFYPRMPKGGITVIGSLDTPERPGEGIAVMEELGIGNLRLQRIGYEPYWCYIVKE